MYHVSITYNGKDFTTAKKGEDRVFMLGFLVQSIATVFQIARIEMENEEHIDYVLVMDLFGDVKTIKIDRKRLQLKHCLEALTTTHSLFINLVKMHAHTIQTEKDLEKLGDLVKRTKKQPGRIDISVPIVTEAMREQLRKKYPLFTDAEIELYYNDITYRKKRNNESIVKRLDKISES